MLFGLGLFALHIPKLETHPAKHVPNYCHQMDYIRGRFLHHNCMFDLNRHQVLEIHPVDICTRIQNYSSIYRGFHHIPTHHYNHLLAADYVGIYYSYFYSCVHLCSGNMAALLPMNHLIPNQVYLLAILDSVQQKNKD